MRQTLLQVRNTAGTVADAAGDILDTSATVARRTDEQARTVAHTMQDMQALTQAARASADHARGACELAGASSTVVARGSGEILSVIHIMGEINEACGRITEIIGVIDSIAFQTNILALNAAVEAVRAGEHGKGFAVVAGEVRQLAHRCGAAAKEIRGLINTSVERAHAGTELVGHTGETMNEVVASIGKLATLVEELATLGDNQRSGIEGMARRVAEIQAAFEENAELVASAAEAARVQRQQTEGLNRAVGVPGWADTRSAQFSFSSPVGKCTPARRAASMMWRSIARCACSGWRAASASMMALCSVKVALRAPRR